MDNSFCFNSAIKNNFSLIRMKLLSCQDDLGGYNTKTSNEYFQLSVSEDNLLILSTSPCNLTWDTEKRWNQNHSNRPWPSYSGNYKFAKASQNVLL